MFSIMRTINVIQFFTGLANGELALSWTAALIQFCTLAESAQPPLWGNKMRNDAAAAAATIVQVCRECYFIRILVKTHWGLFARTISSEKCKLSIVDCTRMGSLL